MRLHRACGSVEFGKVASGSAMLGFWLGDRKVGSQAINEDQSRLLGSGTVGEVRRGGTGASNRVKKRICRFGVRFGLKRRASHLPCLCLGHGDDR